MDSIFWLKEHVIAGRPGPDRVPWNLSELKARGFARVLSVNDGALVHSSDFNALGIEYRCIPLSESAPPLPGDKEHCLSVLPKALDFVIAPLPKGSATLVHCSSGKDRTGLFLCYYLCTVSRCSPRDAMAEVKRVRPIAMSAPGWEEFAYQVLCDAVT